MSEPYKGPITRPCSACSAGDYKVEHHDHDYVNATERACIWQSDTSSGFKFWKTYCGRTFEMLEDECPGCRYQVRLVGFDAWWEARKSYHP